jgi:phage terminase large subunit-like protein
MGKPSSAASHLTPGEPRALASFLAGRLPAGQLHGELCRAREAALAQAARSAPVAAPRPAPALQVA